MNQPLISIIVVTYNAAGVIEKTLQSAIHQTYKNIELVIIDGASTDDTVKIAQQFSPYIGTLISEKDGGIFYAMNKGIQHAKGEWIFFLNAGDCFYDTTVLEDIFTKTYDPCVELIYGKVRTINHSSGVNLTLGRKVSIKDIYTDFAICHQAVFTHKNAFCRIGHYDTALEVSADPKWFACFFLQSTHNQSLFINRIICFYDVCGSGNSSKRRITAVHDRLKYGMQLFPWYIKLWLILTYPYTVAKLWASLKVNHIPLLKQLNAARRKMKNKHIA